MKKTAKKLLVQNKEAESTSVVQKKDLEKSTHAVHQEIAEKVRFTAEQLEQRKKRMVVVLSVLGVLFIFVAVFLLLLLSSGTVTETYEVPVHSSEIRTVYEEVSQKSSLQDFVVNKRLYANKAISFNARLKKYKQGSENASIVRYAAVDDAGVELLLERLTDKQKQLFVEDALSQQVYQVRGVLKTAVPGVTVQVSVIQETSMQTYTVEKNVTINVTTYVNKTRVVETDSKLLSWFK